MYPGHFVNQQIDSKSSFPTLPNLPLLPKHSKRKFTPEEDERLIQIVSQYGESSWKRIADHMANRNCRQCRERWKNYLAPSVCKEPWTEDEDNLLQKKYAELGSQWSLIAKFFPKRTDVNLKNRWVVLTNHTTQEKRVRRTSNRKLSQTANIPQPILIGNTQPPTNSLYVDNKSVLSAQQTGETLKSFPRSESYNRTNTLYCSLPVIFTEDDCMNMFGKDDFDIFTLF